MKGSLVVLKNLDETAKPGIVMCNPWKVPKYTHDFMDGYRHWDGQHIEDEPEDHRLKMYAVEVYWPDKKTTTRHRLIELDFLHLKG